MSQLYILSPLFSSDRYFTCLFLVSEFVYYTSLLILTIYNYVKPNKQLINSSTVNVGAT